MYIHDLIELSFGCLIERLVQGSSGIVHQVIEPLPTPTSKRAAAVVNEPIEQSDISGIELKCGSFPAHRSCLAHEALGFGQIRVICEENIHASSSEIDRRVTAESAASSGNDCYSVVSVAHSFLLGGVSRN